MTEPGSDADTQTPTRAPRMKSDVVGVLAILFASAVTYLIAASV